MSKITVGAIVKYCGHEATFIADILNVNGANVVRSNGPLTERLLNRKKPLKFTHTMSDFPVGGFWRPDLGVFVVPENQVVQVSNGAASTRQCGRKGCAISYPHNKHESSDYVKPNEPWPKK